MTDGSIRIRPMPGMSRRRACIGHPMDFVRKELIMELISTDRTKCVKCNACAEICPMRVIAIGEEGFPGPTTEAFKLCINCGYCVDVCSFGALKHKVRKHSPNSGAALKRLKKIKENRRKRGEM